MNLFILRHGEAESLYFKGGASKDSQRQLTERGRREVAAVIERHQTELQTVTNIFASPYVRAQQTAQIVAQALGQAKLDTLNVITPNHSTTDVMKFLVKQDENDTILLVSHQPLVSAIIADLCETPQHQIRMHTAALASISLQPVASGMGQLNFID